MKRKFSLTDKDGVNTYLYHIKEKNVEFYTEKQKIMDDEIILTSFNRKKEYAKVYNLEQLSCEQEKNGELGYILRTYNFNDMDNSEILIVTLQDDRVYISIAKVEDDKIYIANDKIIIFFKNIEIVKSKEEFIYTPSVDRKIFIIDIENGEVIDPKFHIIGGKKEGKCILFPNKKYLAIEIRGKQNRTIATGICEFRENNNKYKTIINDNEAKRLNLDKILKEIKNKSRVFGLTDTAFERER